MTIYEQVLADVEAKRLAVLRNLSHRRMARQERFLARPAFRSWQRQGRFVVWK